MGCLIQEIGADHASLYIWGFCSLAEGYLVLRMAKGGTSPLLVKEFSLEMSLQVGCLILSKRNSRVMGDNG